MPLRKYFVTSLNQAAAKETRAAAKTQRAENAKKKAIAEENQATPQ
jgi:hypothetical protein